MTNSSVQFAHIAPTAYLRDFTRTNDVHLVLAHLVETDPAYAAYYRSLDDGKLKIMDNAGFEMFKQGKPMYPSDRLIDVGRACNADIIVMSDYPSEHVDKTIAAAEAAIPQFKQAGFGTFFVPQSEPGRLDQLLRGLEWGLNRPDVDLIGLSILACPIAFGVERNNPLQRFLSRWHVLQHMDRAGLLRSPSAHKRFHCLGMVDGPREMNLLRPYFPFIRSWDSSAAVWAGLHGRRFDSSPTGLIGGKFELEVDFGFPFSEQLRESADVAFNVSLIDKLKRDEA